MKKKYLHGAEKMKVGDSFIYNEVNNIRSIRNACNRLKRDKKVIFEVSMIGTDSVMVTRCA